LGRGGGTIFKKKKKNEDFRREEMGLDSYGRRKNRTFFSIRRGGHAYIGGKKKIDNLEE